jgi:hypothetical protein
MLKVFFSCLCGLLLYVPSWAADNPIGLAHIAGPVVSVLGGDTIEVLNGHHAERICLSEADRPAQAIQKKNEGRNIT